MRKIFWFIELKTSLLPKFWKVTFWPKMIQEDYHQVYKKRILNEISIAAVRLNGSSKIRKKFVKLTQNRTDIWYHIFCPRWQQNPCLFWDAYRFLHVFIREINVDFTICLTFEYFYSRNFRKNINFLDLFQFLVFMYFFQEKPPTACLSLLHLFGLSLCFEKVCKSIIAVFCFFPMDTFGFFWSYLN